MTSYLQHTKDPDLGALEKRLRKIASYIGPRKNDEHIVITGCSLKAGSRIIKKWRGQTLCVSVFSDHYEYDGRRYESLSAISKELMGSNCSGNIFFGLRSRKYE
jgi:hypothetical protein